MTSALGRGTDHRFGSGWTSGVLSATCGALGGGGVLCLLHHWHHAANPVDKNFAVHLPWIDRLFGTAYLPAGRWPEVYGIAGHPVPEGYWHQLAWPFRAGQARTRSDFGS